MEDIQIEVLNYEEQEDGSAIITLELNEKARDIFIQMGFNAILKDALQNLEESYEKDSCCGACSSDVGCKC